MSLIGAEICDLGLDRIFPQSWNGMGKDISCANRELTNSDDTLIHEVLVGFVKLAEGVDARANVSINSVRSRATLRRAQSGTRQPGGGLRWESGLC